MPKTIESGEYSVSSSNVEEHIILDANFYGFTKADADKLMAAFLVKYPELDGEDTYTFTVVEDQPILFFIEEGIYNQFLEYYNTNVAPYLD